MNQDQVKENLLAIEDDVEEFFVIFSGKASKKVNGLYKPDTREIIIHNRNFENDGSLLYTAIHEFAHHLHFTTSAVPVGPRAHTLEFRNILHRLLQKAEEAGVYTNPFADDPEFQAMTGRLRSEFLTRNGEIMKQFGQALIEAQELCSKRGVRFDDYVERVLAMDMRSAKTLMKIKGYDISPSIGYTNMATVAGIGNEEKRLAAQEAFESGESPDMVKVSMRPAQFEQSDPLLKLEKEKHRLQRTIRSLEDKLDDVERRISTMGGSSADTGI